MPEFEITSPDGQRFIVNAPAGATQDEIFEYAQTQFSAPEMPQQEIAPPQLDMVPSHQTAAPPPGGSQSLVSKALGAFGAPALSPESKQYLGGLGETYGDAALLGFGSEYGAGLEALRQRDTGAYGEEMSRRTKAKQRFAQENPKTAIAASIAGGLTGGLAAAPKSLLGTLALGGVEGAGTMEEDRLMGGVLGAGGAGLVAGGLKAAQALPGVKRGLSNLFPKAADEIKLPENKLDQQARRALSAFASRTGGVDEAVPNAPILSVAERLKGGNQLVRSLAASSDEGARVVRESGLADRAKNVSERLRSTTGLDDAQVAKADKTFNKLSEKISDIGIKIEKRVVETRDVPLKNQAKLQEFLDLPGNRGVLKEAVDALKNRGKPIQYGADGDANQIMINEELAQEIAHRLSGKVTALKPNDFMPTNTADYAMAQNLKHQFDDILAESTTDPTLRKLRKDYSKANKRRSSFESGVTGEGLENDLKLLQQSGKRTGKQGALFAEGTRGNLASGNNLMTRLQNPDTMRRLKTILPEADINKFETAVQVENIVKNTSDTIDTGLDYLNGRISKETFEGKIQARAMSVLETMSGKRAYSPIGGVFLLGNEVLEAMGRTDLPEPVIERVASMVTRTGDDANVLLKQLVEIDIPKFQKEKVLRTMKRVLTNAAGIGAAATPASLQEALSGN